jgi:hypothetical protein
VPYASEGGEPMLPGKSQAVVKISRAFPSALFPVDRAERRC